MKNKAAQEMASLKWKKGISEEERKARSEGGKKGMEKRWAKYRAEKAKEKTT